MLILILLNLIEITKPLETSPQATSYARRLERLTETAEEASTEKDIVN